MVKFVCVLLLICAVAGRPCKKRDGHSNEEEQWEKIEEILEEYGVDVEAVIKQMETYWKDPVRVAKVKAIITENMPKGKKGKKLKAKLEEIQSGEGTDTEKFEQVMGAIEEYGGRAGKKIIKKIMALTKENEHKEKFQQVVKELLPSDVNFDELKKEIMAALADH